MPVGALAAILILIVAGWGRRLHNEEMQTGAKPRGFDLFLAITIGTGGLIFYLGAVKEIEFFWDLMATITGAFIALTAVHYGLPAARSLVAGLRR